MTIEYKAKEIANSEYMIYKNFVSGMRTTSELECYSSAMKMAEYMNEKLKSALNELMIDTRDKERIITLMSK